MRRLLPAALAVVATLGLVACSGEAAPDPSETDVDRSADVTTCADSGSASDSVTVSGDLGSAPTVSFDAPLHVDSTERSVVIADDGDEVELGGSLKINFSVYNGSTGQKATSTDYGPANAILAVADPGQVLPGIAATLLCSTAGSRVVGVVAADDAFGSEGYADLGIDPDTTLVFVIDVLEIVEMQAEGTAQRLPSDFPALGLEFARDGRPTVTIPDADPPSELRVGVLIAGDGAVVGERDEFTLQYQGVNWTTGEVFDETWGEGPRALSSAISGFRAAIVGQTVGSRVVVVIPPADGYGADGNPNAGIAGTDTIVFVIDILSTAPPA